jgi:hypothetical protein
MFKISKLSIIAVVIAMAVGFAFSISPVQADGVVDLGVSHRINGRALGLEDKELPVDIWVNGDPFLTSVPFGTSARFEVPAGEYNVEIYLAGSDPAEVDPIMSLSATLAGGLKVDLIATLGAGRSPILRAVVR